MVLRQMKACSEDYKQGSAAEKAKLHKGPLMPSVLNAVAGSLSTIIEFRSVKLHVYIIKGKRNE